MVSALRSVASSSDKKQKLRKKDRKALEALRSEQSSILARMPKWGKYAAAGTAIMAFLGAIAGNWTSWGFPYFALRPSYDEFVSKTVSSARKDIESKIEKLDDGTRLIASKADRNNIDVLRARIATIAVHESLLRAQLTAVHKDPAFTKSYNLQNQARDYEAHITSLKEEHRQAVEALRNAEAVKERAPWPQN